MFFFVLVSVFVLVFPVIIVLLQYLRANTHTFLLIFSFLIAFLMSCLAASAIRIKNRMHCCVKHICFYKASSINSLWAPLVHVYCLFIHSHYYYFYYYSQW